MTSALMTSALMTNAEQAVTNLFVALTFLANALTLAILVGAVIALIVPGSRPGLAAIVEKVGPAALPLAFAVAATATFGSLYYSLVADLTPCLLCWYQRILMYPLVVILAVSWWRRDTGVWLLSAPFVVLGAGVALFHVLVERYPSLGDGLECSLEAPCSVPWFTEAGFVTIAYMSLAGFLAVAALLGLDAAWNRKPTGEENVSEEGVSEEGAEGGPS
ncbi:MAG: disulfide bond formation protein B [Acidimicrobiia bacterium]|nr:disulfide bond formation protein B [Acidimicrobiia bacterium]